MPTKRTSAKKKADDNSGQFEGFSDDSILQPGTSQQPEGIAQPGVANQFDMQLQSLSRQRAQIMSKIIRMYNAVKDFEFGLPQLKVEAKKLEAAYTEFSGFHSQIIAIIPEDRIDEQEAIYVRFEKLYDWTSAQIESLIIKRDLAKRACGSYTVTRQSISSRG